MTRRPFVALALAAPIATAWCGAAAVGQTAPPATSAWSESFEYRVEVDGAVSANARCFNRQGRAAMLLVVPELPQPLVLELTSREVNVADPQALRTGSAPDQVEMDEAGIHGPASPYTMDGATVIFFHQGHRIKIDRKPPLVGDVTWEAILDSLPAYRKGMEEYSPADSDVVYLKGYQHAVKVEVFFGSWCPHCRQTVPRFLKSLEAASNPNIELAFTGVPAPPFTEYPPVKDRGVKGVPTIIVFAGDKEIGRFSAIPDDSTVEHELVKILYAHHQERG